MQEAATLHWDLRSIVSAISRENRDLHTAIQFHVQHTQQSAQRIAVRLKATRRQLRGWRWAKDLAQEQLRYLQNPKPYKSLGHVDKFLG